MDSSLYIPDEPPMLQWDEILTFDEDSVVILGKEVKKLRSREILEVKYSRGTTQSKRLHRRLIRTCEPSMLTFLTLQIHHSA